MKGKIPKIKKVQQTPPSIRKKKSKVSKKKIKPVSFKSRVKERRGAAVIPGGGYGISGPQGYGIVRSNRYLEWANKNKQNSPKGNVIGIGASHNWRLTKKNLSTKRVVVLFHIYYNDPLITQEILKDLQALPFTIDLCVSLIKGKAGNVATKKLIENVFTNVKFFEVRNRGKDIGGKLTMFKHLLIEKLDIGYDYMLLIHDKKSPHSTVISGEGWRKELLRGVLHHTSVKTGFSIMEQDNEIIGFGSARWLRGGPISIVTMIGPRTAKEFIDKMLTKLGRKIPTHFGFVGGTMFWCKYHPMMSFWTVETLDTALKMLESGDIREPSYTHAMERILGMILTTFNRKTLLGV